MSSATTGGSDRMEQARMKALASAHAALATDPLVQTLQEAVLEGDYAAAAQIASVLADHLEQHGYDEAARWTRGGARRYIVTAWAREVFDPERVWQDVEFEARTRGELRRFSLPLSRTARGFGRYGLGRVTVSFDRRGNLKVEELFGAEGPRSVLAQYRIAMWMADRQKTG